MGEQRNRPVPRSTVCQRRYLGLTTAAAARAVAGCDDLVSDGDSGDGEDGKNGEPSTEATVTVDPDARNERDVPETFDGATAAVTVQRATDDPYALQVRLGDFPDSWYDWAGLEAYEIDEDEAPIENGVLTLSLEPSAIARVRLD